MISDSEYNQILSMLIREIRRQVVAPKRAIRLRLELYYSILWSINVLWIKTEYALRRACQEGFVEYRKVDGMHWYYVSGTNETEIEAALKKKRPIMKEWVKASKTSGTFLQGIVRDAFSAAGYEPTVTPYKIALADGSTVEVDVATTPPGPIYYVEVKNKFSEVYVAPTLKSRLSSDDKQILKLFQVAKERDIVPMLFAPLVDRSFYGFQKAFKGLFFSPRIQYLPQNHSDLCEDIRNHFLIGNIKSIASPPPHMITWINKIPEWQRRQQQHGANTTEHNP